MDQVGRAYSEMATEYIDLIGSGTAVHQDDLALIERHLSIPLGTVLDLGCGPGHLTAYLRSLGVDAAGIDLVPEFIAHARATYPDGHYDVGSMHRLDAPDRSVRVLGRHRRRPLRPVRDP